MKLPIKDRFFKEIKQGKKRYEYRDAHITFINEKTGETLIKKVTSSMVVWRGCVKPKRYQNMIEDDYAIIFRLED